MMTLPLDTPKIVGAAPSEALIVVCYNVLFFCKQNANLPGDKQIETARFTSEATERQKTKNISII